MNSHRLPVPDSRRESPDDSDKRGTVGWNAQVRDGECHEFDAIQDAQSSLILELQLNLLLNGQERNQNLNTLCGKCLYVVR